MDNRSIFAMDAIARQTIISVQFYTFDGGIGEGSIVLDRELADDIGALFKLMFDEKFPITSAIPVSDPRFKGDDELSMVANNTSAFNDRPIAGTEKISNHAIGRAIDINPLLNPYIREGVVQPKNAVYDPSRPGTITADSFIVIFLKKRGWTWGGDWHDLKDYQHFEK